VDSKYNVFIFCDTWHNTELGLYSWCYLLKKAFERSNDGVFFVVKQQGKVLDIITSYNEKTNFDSDMDCYGVTKYQDKFFMFYNGNDYCRLVGGLVVAYV